MNGIFDPLNYGPKLDWDDYLPPLHYEEWAKFFTQAFELKNLKFERCMKPREAW